MRGWTLLALAAVIVGNGCEQAARETDSAVPTSPGGAPAADAGFSVAREGRQLSLKDQQSSGGGALPPADASAHTGSQTGASSMIIRSGSAVIEVDSLEPAIAQVRLLAQRLGGYVANTSMQVGREELRSATLELKIPAERFDLAVSGLQPIGRVEAVNVTAEDVGEEFVDVSARVANSRRLEERLIQLLATRTGKLEDILQVERELARVREEIERYEGRLRFLRTRAALSTLSVTVHEPAPIIGAYRGSSVIGDAFRAAWRNFVGFAAGVIASLGIVIPLSVIGVVIWLVVRRFLWRPGGGTTPPTGGTAA